MAIIKFLLLMPAIEIVRLLYQRHKNNKSMIKG